MEKEKSTQMLMKDNEQTTVHSILKEQWDLLGEKKQNKRAINAEINTKNKFGKRKCTVINK